MKDVHVLAIVTEAFGGHGGIAQYNRDLIAAVAGGPWRASIDVLPRLAPEQPQGAPDRVRQHMAVFARPAFVLKAIWLALRRRPDVIFCGHLYMAPFAAVLARLAGARLAVQLHGVEIWDVPTPAQRRAVDAADLALCVSRDTRRRVLGWSALPPERVVVLPNTVQDAYEPGDRRQARERFGLGAETVLLSVGRLDARERYKGHDLVLRILPRFTAERGAATYLIAGDGDDRPRLEALAASLGVTAQVRFLGKVAADDLPTLYQAADAFVLPSSGEGFGIVYLEAMACGTPAIGLARGGAIDALGDGELGSAIESEDLLAAVARALFEGSGETKRHSLAQRTRERFGSSSFQSFAQATLARLV